MATDRQDAPAKIDLEIKPGSVFTRSLTCWSAYDEDLGTGTEEDLTGWTAKAHVRSRPGGSLILNLNPTITAPATGVVSISIPRATTTVLRPGKYYWDLWLKTPGGVDIEVCAGNCLVEQKITDLT